MKTYFLSYDKEGYFIASYNHHTKKYYWSEWYNQEMEIPLASINKPLNQFTNIPIEDFINIHTTNSQNTGILPTIKNFPKNFIDVKSQYPELFI